MHVLNFYLTFQYTISVVNNTQSTKLNTEDSLLAPQGLLFKWISPDPFLLDWLKIYLPRSSYQWPISWTEYYLRLFKKKGGGGGLNGTNIQFNFLI
jgi:hypothetical protein